MTFENTAPMRIGLAGLPSDDLDWIVQSLRDRAHELSSSRILITGASGFVGRWVVAALVEMRTQLHVPDLSVQILVRNSSTAQERLGAELWNHVEVVEADIKQPLSLRQPASHVVHGATPSSTRSGSGDGRGVLLTSVSGTHNLIQAISAFDEAPRVLHLSSGAVYGPQPSEVDRIPENWGGGPSPFLTTAPYAEGKRAAEALLEAAGRDDLLKPLQARLFAFVGPGLPTNEGFAIGNFIRQACIGEAIHLTGDGSNTRSYIDARSLVVWLIRILLDGEVGTPYNVGSPFGHSLRDWAHMCAELVKVPVVLGDQVVGERLAYVPDVSNSIKIGIHPPSDDIRPSLWAWIQWLRANQR